MVFNSDPLPGFIKRILMYYLKIQVMWKAEHINIRCRCRVALGENLLCILFLYHLMYPETSNAHFLESIQVEFNYCYLWLELQLYKLFGHWHGIQGNTLTIICSKNSNILLGYFSWRILVIVSTNFILSTEIFFNILVLGSPYKNVDWPLMFAIGWNSWSYP